MNSKLLEFVIYVAVSLAIYLLYRQVIKRQPALWLDSLVGWLMFSALGLCLAAVFSLPHSRVVEILWGSIVGISMSLGDPPRKGRVPPVPYKLARWLVTITLIWAIGGALGLYK